MNHVTDPVHFTNLKRFALSPKHYLASIGDEKDRLEFRLGRLTHALVLGAQPDSKWDVFDGIRRGKKWEEFVAARPGVDIFTVKEREACRVMADAIVKDPVVVEYDLLSGETELPVVWTHSNGRKCATRGLDILDRKKRRLVEIKTTVSSQPERFARDAIRKFAYHAQGAFYRDAARSIDVDVNEVIVVAVEKAKPNLVTCHRFTADALLEGEKLVHTWMSALRRCEESNQWPGYAQSILDLDIDGGDLDIDFDSEPDETDEAAA